MSQLDIFGDEGPIPEPERRQPPLTPAQQDVLLVIRRNGSIRPVEAGLILYAHQGSDESRNRYASTDGHAMLVRMARRGLVHWDSPGRWAEGPAPALSSSGGFAPVGVLDLGVIRDTTINAGAAANQFRVLGEALGNTGVSFGTLALRIAGMSDAMRERMSREVRAETKRLQREALGDA